MPVTFSSMNRREFLASSFALGVLTACSSSRSSAIQSGVPDSAPEHWVFLSDIHLTGNPDTFVERFDAKGNKYNMYNNFV
ncbi:MAG: hypothetical protein LBN93_00120, partial [Candidatus Symbiothrix sp.]|nr:hypothetical protein [Candidatus Symbiothrix sp.]